MNLCGLPPQSVSAKAASGALPQAAHHGSGHSGFANLLAGILSGGQGQRDAVTKEQAGGSPVAKAHPERAELQSTTGQSARSPSATKRPNALQSRLLPEIQSARVQSAQTQAPASDVTGAQTGSGSDEDHREEDENRSASTSEDNSSYPSPIPEDLTYLGIVPQPPTPAVASEPVRVEVKTAQVEDCSFTEQSLPVGEPGTASPNLLSSVSATNGMPTGKTGATSDDVGGIPLNQIPGFESVVAESAPAPSGRGQAAARSSKTTAASQVNLANSVAVPEVSEKLVLPNAERASTEPQFSGELHADAGPEIPAKPQSVTVAGLDTKDPAVASKQPMAELEKTPANAVQADKKAEAKESGEVLQQSARTLLADSRSTGPMLARASQARAEIKRPNLGRVEGRADEPIGTAVAPNQKLMSRAEQQNEIAGPEKQNLPEKAEALAQNGASPAQSGGDALSRTSAPEPKAQAPAATPLASDQFAGASASKRNTSDTSAAPLPTMNKLAANITHEAVIMRQFKPDKLDVVLRPDATTQISLQLRYVDNEILGSARCDRGDFTLLNAHWTELQRSMDQQGIRLSPLKEPGYDSASLGNGSAFGNSNQSPYEQRARKLEEVLLAEPAPRRASSDNSELRTRRTNSGGRLLQTWA